MRTDIHGDVYLVEMPLDKWGNGPAIPEAEVLTRYEVWDQVCQVICVCQNADDARAIVAFLNEEKR